ncbi:MAG: hypothetical protein CMJ85_01025 [Planctomycetes bacterium]|nr:hypothetical protein [Planctomycetota bacterium]MDP6424834.1 hypothetical protein [Planctomycetota bacterium]
MLGVVGAAALASGLLAVYLVLGQSTFYRTDGFQLVFLYLERHAWARGDHPLYLTVAGPFVEALRDTGLGSHRLATVFSALCTSLATCIVWLHARYARLTRAATVRWMLLVGLCPAVLLFATVVEFHAFFLPFAALAFLVAEVLLRQRGGRALLVAVVLALVTFMASLAHGTGNLLVPLLGAWIMGRSDPGLRKHRFALLCAFAAAHTVFLFLGRPLFLCWIGDPPGSGLVAWLQQWFDAEGWAERVVHLALWEVLVPFLPLSLIVLLPFVRKHRWHTGWAIAGFVPYGLLCVLVLRDPEIDEPMWEHGSYLLPLAIPAGWIVVHSLGHLSHRAWAGVLALSLVASVTFTLQHDTRPGEEWGSDARAILDERSTILWAGSIELPWALIETPRVRVLHTIEGWASAAKDFGAWQSATRRLIDEHLAGGGRMLLSRHARSDLENPQFKLIGAPMWAFFEKTWKLQPLQSGGFEGWEMVR